MEMLCVCIKITAILFVGATAFTNAEQCLSSIGNRDTRLKRASTDGQEIIIQVSDNILHQITSRIFGTLATEFLNENVIYKDVQFPPEMSETDKLYYTFKEIVESKRAVLNLGVWMPANYHSAPPEIENVGRFGTGRYGWFIPKKLLPNNDLSPFIPYIIFKDNNNEKFQRFMFDDSILAPFELEEQYIPDHCKNQQCVTLLSGHVADTYFLKHHINELKLYVKIAWFGDNLRHVIKTLLERLSEKRFKNQKSFVVAHWTPSEIMEMDTEYETIIMPKCEQFVSDLSKEMLCRYELTPILIYCSKELMDTKKSVYSMLSFINFEQENEIQLLKMYNNITARQMARHSKADNDKNGNNSVQVLNTSNREKIYDQIACEFIRENERVFKQIMKKCCMAKRKVYIGGIFPKQQEDENEFLGIKNATQMAKEDVRNNVIGLANIDLDVINNDDGCHLDTVMKTFINYYVKPDVVLGVLGPPCSETVEPIASLSKHIHMAVISYAAEGDSFKNHEYPYFFRTIGENRQYEHVYVQLLKELNWRRVVAFTEGGQKYTEYIIQLGMVLKENGIDLTNKQFSKYVRPDEIRTSLQEMKDKESRIIIADINNEQAGVVLCEAYKLEMSAKQGYVWFLPIWLDKNSNEIYESNNVNCTREQIYEILDGHFSLAHQSYASDESIMQTNATVGDWKKKFQLSNTSHYGGYAYDAFWVYALALDQLIAEYPDSLNTIHELETTERFIKIISDTNFNGVSGHIQFGATGARFSNINVLQWIDNENRVVGTFEPNVSDVNGNREIQGGKFNFSVSNIKWLTPNNAMPDDGSEVCSVGGLAQLLGYDCSKTELIIVLLLCSLLAILLSAGSYVFLKRRYDQKLKVSAKLLRNFGIDLKLMYTGDNINTLDKWEVPKDRVVINRRLGEGAFGTVYGGEAQIGEQGWAAVAVKTLKKGSNTEDRLDFLSEAEAMKRFDHANIIQLLGVCLQTEPIYAVMEFMLYGDLKTYLLARRHLVNEKICDDSDISPKRLTMMALDISKALSYLSEMKYVHRDVACRNCLVNAQRVVKLGDFGMARSTSENDYYRFSRKGMLPVRWMAPESLSFGKFTPASDIWSFGVLLYEIITFGSFPFQGMTNNQVLEHVKEGNTLTIPNGIKPQLEGLMKACWNISYIKRPTASEVAEFIAGYPKLVTASLDVPLASVQIPETESDQLELLPGLRATSNDEHHQTEPSYSNHVRIPNGITLSEFNAANDDYTMSNPATPSITYNPIEPLLAMYQGGGANDSTLRRYVPMHGIKRGHHTLEMNEHVI